MQTNILEYLEQTAPRLPHKIAFSNGTEDLCFSDLLNLSRRIGSALADAGYKKAPIAVLMEKHPHQIAAFFGVIYAGCYSVPLDPEMPDRRMELILEQVGASVLLVDEIGEKRIANLSFKGAVLRFADLIQKKINDFVLNGIRQHQIDTDPIYIVFTSGSTGIPKGVVACHRSVIDYTEALCLALPFSEDTVYANQTPLYFDAPLKEIMPTIKYGATVYFVPRQLFLFPMKLCDFLNEKRINTICWVVSALVMISSFGCLEKNPPKYLSTVAFGSEVFPRPQYELWRKALPKAEFYNLYGPTEATGMSCFWHADRELEQNEPIPIGQPFRNTDLFLLNEQGTLAGEGEPGEIYLRGTCVTLGYYNNPEKTAEAFVQNPLQNHYPELVYRTGDIGKYNERGELVFLSRRDAQIKHMGHRIELGEIEAAAALHPNLRRACCVYDAERKRIVLFYVGDVTPAELIAFFKSYLPRYMIPNECVRKEAMPLTPNGKLDRKLLKAEACGKENS